MPDAIPESLFLKGLRNSGERSERTFKNINGKSSAV